MRRVRVIAILLLASCDGAWHAQTWAQSWPGKPIHVIVPFTAGSATDITARTVFEQVGRQIGQPVVIESRLGAGGTTASAAVARSEPDGTTVLFTSSAYTITPLERLHREIVTALEPPEVKERIVKLGGEPTSLSPSEFDALLKAELETNAVVVRASGLKAN